MVKSGLARNRCFPRTQQILVLCAVGLISLLACDGESARIAPLEVVSTDALAPPSSTNVDTQGSSAGAQQVSEPASGNDLDPALPAEPFYRATVEDITDLVLVTGQSNALGAGTGYDEYLDAPSNRVFAFTNNGWQIANLNQVWDRNWFPRNDPETPPSNNFSLHFGKRVASKAPDRVVGFVLLSAPGQPISHWDRDSEFFNQIRDKVSRAINELPYKNRVDAILWHQGESDGADRPEYGDALYDLIARFRSEPWFGYETPFICGDTAESPVNQQLRRLNTDNEYWTACIEAQGLPVLPGTVHFSAPALRTIGKRYADAYLEKMLGIR